ncbi:RNA recognition motif domain [Macleaya cordata]|uniref:RNA recognition motif domain n=1 Tax=Macleaya cordata TaxID=56857 RepID=A0A200PVW9_MACCD|nr:RNA recognition motif domain [Macleaya cordata]
MSRISRTREKYDNGNELLGDNANEGTAARTRPFTFEEIMLRRKNNKLSVEAKEGAGDPDEHLGKDNAKKVSNHSERDGVYEDAMNHASEDTVKRSSTKKQESTSLKEGHLVRGKGKESSDAEANLMEKLDKDVKNRDKEDKNERRSHRRSRNEERSRGDFENESEKKHSGNSVRKEKYVDTERRKSESESKRKQRTRDEEKNRFEDGKAVKKHDSGKWYDLEPAGRKSRKKESSQSHYEEARSKTRRSRSREKRDRDRRSISLSPRAHKRSFYQGREHGESSHHSFKDRKHSDVDRNRTSSNGGYGNSHYQRRGGRGSRLGGYSPRKRRTEAAVKTPSPTARSPERKSAGWDLPPTGTDIHSAGSMLPNFQTSRQTVSSNVNELPATVPAASNAAKSLSGASPNTLSESKNVSMDSIQLTQATRSMRRLYLENVPTSASDKSIMDCFNNFFLSSDAYHIQGTPPCISCIINKEKGQALVEFLTPEDAVTALSFDGRSFSGSILKVRRSEDSVESATGVPEKPVAVVDAISDDIKDSPYKIFIGGISKVLSSDMVMEIASAFGALRGYHFKVNEDANGACAFLEYVDKSITLKACAGLNGMKLGGKVLTVVQATPDASIEDKTEDPPHYGIPEHAKALLSKPTKVLKLKNVLNQEELLTLSEPEVEEVLEDIRLECARYGTVKSVNVVRNGRGSTTATSEVTNQADVRSSSQHTEGENNIVKPEVREEEIDPNSGENSRPEAPNDVRETPVDGGDAENNRPSHDEHEEDNLNTDIPTSHLDTDTNPQGSPPQLDTTKDQSAQNDNNSADFLLRDNSSIKNSSMVEEELKNEEGNRELQEASMELNDTSRRNSDTTENGENKQQLDVFEEGCVLVEYARKEASCAAAHCLHGRLYGNRIVAVGYVDHDLYISRFPK